jgi:hypothetical protein
MPRRSKPRKKKRVSIKLKAAREGVNPLQTGMPALDSITGVQEIREGNKVRRIIHTNEIDEYEKPISKANLKKTLRKKRS